MVWKCPVPGCDTNWANRPRVNFSLFTFPVRKPELLARWLEAINRPDLRPTPSTKLCSTHFYQSDILHASSDTNASRVRKRMAGLMDQHQPLLPLKRTRLRKGAVPTLLPQLPWVVTRRKDGLASDRRARNGSRRVLIKLASQAYMGKG